MNNAINTGRNPIEAQNAEALKQKQMRDILGTDVETSASRKMIDKANDNPKYLQEQVNINSGKYAERLRMVGNKLYARLHTGTPEAPSWSARVDTVFNELDTDKTASRLHEIANGLQVEDKPDYEEGEKMRSAYVSTTRPEYVRGPNPVRIPMYHITRKLYADMDYLQKLYAKPLSAPQKQVVRELLNALGEYAREDMGRMFKEALTGKTQYTTSAILKMGKILGVMGLVGAGVGLSVINMIQGKVPAAGIVSIGAAICLASEDFRKSLFGGKNEASFREIDTFVKDKFLETAEDYKMKGPVWEKFTKRMISPDDRTQAFNRKWEAGAATQADMKAFAEYMLPFDQYPLEHENLMKMLNSTNKKSFQYAVDLQKMKDPDARIATAGMIKLGMGECRIKAREIEFELPAMLKKAQEEQTA